MNFDQTGTPRIGTVIRCKKPATCISYHEEGTHLYVASEEDSSLRVVDCQRGTSDSPALRFEKDGIRLVEATHHKQCVLYSGKGHESQSSGQRHAIHYLSLHDNKILRHFRGHSADIADLSMSPVDDTFLSSGKDRTVRQWNLKQAGPLAEMNVPKAGNRMVLDSDGIPHTSYDSTGLVFGITAPLASVAGHLIHLYDARNFGNGAFAEFKVEQGAIQKVIQRKVMVEKIAAELSVAKWTSMKFNTSGKKIIVTTSMGVVLVIDGYNGTVTDAFVSEPTVANTTPLEPISGCFTVDDKAVLCGNADGTISCWNADTGALMQKLQGHVGGVGCIASNPKYAQIASACTNTAIWLW